MGRVLVASVLALATIVLPETALAQKEARGEVIEHSGEPGDFIVSRDSVVYWLSTGDDLYSGDIVRAQGADTATITFNGCEMTMPEKEDVTLDDEFCVIAGLVQPSMAAIASQGGPIVGTTTATTTASSPLIVGGVVLSAGGLAAATNGGNGGTGSIASAAAGAPQANADP
ncbi:MAG: hypothetical protein AAF437_11485 [Pseudomonadota bacterium]